MKTKIERTIEGCENLGLAINQNTPAELPKSIKIKRFIIQDRESGNVIESNLTFEEAVKKVSEFENSDKKEGIYVPDFYEIREDEGK